MATDCRRQLNSQGVWQKRSLPITLGTGASYLTDKLLEKGLKLIGLESVKKAGPFAIAGTLVGTTIVVPTMSAKPGGCSKASRRGGDGEIRWPSPGAHQDSGPDRGSTAGL